MSIKHYIKDMVYGASDGIITSFAVISGVIGAGLSIRVIIIIGFASLFADAFSMAVSNYLGSKSEKQLLVIENDRVLSRKIKPFINGFMTLMAFALAGSIPLVPYLLFDGENLFLYAILATAFALFVVGSMRTLVTERNFIAGGIEMLVIGGVAALVAYLVGTIISGLV